MSRSAYIIVIALTTVFPALIARADSREQQRDPSKVPGSSVRQLMFKQSLDMEMSGTLVAELNQNKKIWRSLNPEELRSLRERYYAFLKQDGKKQIELMEAAEKFHRLTDKQRRAYLKRASWLKKVVARLTPEQRRALQKLTPAERARRLLELKAKLSDPPPTTQPASQPASRPASKTANYWSE